MISTPSSWARAISALIGSRIVSKIRIPQLGRVLVRRVRGGALLAGVALRSHPDRLALALLGLDDRDRHVLLVLLRGLADLDGRAGGHRLREHLVGERVLDVALDRPAQRARAHRGIPALLDEEVRGIAG